MGRCRGCGWRLDVVERCEFVDHSGTWEGGPKLNQITATGSGVTENQIATRKRREGGRESN